MNAPAAITITPIHVADLDVEGEPMPVYVHVIDHAIAQADDRTLGLCVVCHDYVEPELLEMDYTTCVCLDHLSAHAKRQLEDELELSQAVQRALLPQEIPAIPGLEVAAFSRPAQIVGGDYFDFVHFADGTHGLAIADVAGHGVAAGLLMASIQTALHTLVPLCDSPAEVMQRWLAQMRIPMRWPGRWILAHVQEVIGARFDDIAPLRSAAALSCPVLFVHGQEDETVPFSDAVRLAEARGTEASTCLAVPGGHDLTEGLGPEHVQRMMGFLRASLGASPLDNLLEASRVSSPNA